MGSEESLFNGDIISVWDDENVLEIDHGDGYRHLELGLPSLQNCEK